MFTTITLSAATLLWSGLTAAVGLGLMALMATVSGDRATAATQGIQSAKRVIDMADRILLLQPSANPLTVFLQRLDKESVFNPEFKILKDDIRGIVDAINSSSGYTAGDTTLKVDNVGQWQSGDLGLVPRIDEVFRVTGKSATDNTITVNRDVAGASNAKALNDNEPLVNLADTNAEGASVGTPVTTKATTDSNFTQIFRTPFSVTGTLAASRLYGGDDMAYQARKKGIEHLRKLELAAWFGQKKEITSGSTPVRLTGGVDEWITTNETDVGGNLTALEMEAFVRSVFRYGDSENRVMFISREVASAISMLALNKVEQVREDDTFGVSIQRWLSPHGIVNFVVANLFSDADYLKERGYLLDLDQLGYRFLQGRDTHLRTNVQDPGDDSRKDEYLTESGYYRGREESSGRMVGVQVTS